MAKKKPVTGLNSALSRVRKHKIATFFCVIFVVTISLFSYNKYLDYQNVQGATQSLADFQQLEFDFQKTTSEEVTLGIDCGFNGEKFSESYLCDAVYLPMTFNPNTLDRVSPSEAYVSYFSSIEVKDTGCLFSKGGSYEGLYICDFLEVRDGSRKQIIDILRPYKIGLSL